MSVTLLRAYGGYNQGAVVTLTAELEAALIAQGLATSTAVASTTTGAATANTWSGTAAIAAGASSVVITNSNITANSKVIAYVSQAAADGTLLRVERVVPAAGSVTIYGTANATATTIIAWAIVNAPGWAPAA